MSQVKIGLVSLIIGKTLLKGPALIQKLVSCLLRRWMCSLTFNLLLGFCRNRIGSIVAAFRATGSITEAVQSLDSSPTNVLPALPRGTEKVFRIQWTTSSYTMSSSLGPGRLLYVNGCWLTTGIANS